MKKTLSLLSILLVCLILLPSCTVNLPPEGSTETKDSTIATELTTESEVKTEITAESEIKTEEFSKNEVTSQQSTESQTTITEDSSETETESKTETESETDETTVSETTSYSPVETDSEPDETEEASYDGIRTDVVELGNTLSNQVQSYYKDSDRNVFVMENRDTVISYNLNRYLGCHVASITDKDGNTYIQNTLDVFVKTIDGNKYYSSGSVVSPTVNIHRLGYYYYHNLIEGQVFASAEDIKEQEIDHMSITSTSKVEKIGEDKEARTVSYKIISSADPQVTLPKTNFPAAEFGYLEITLKANEGIVPEIELFVWAGGYDGFSSEQRMFQEIIVDGDYHTYIVPLSSVPDYKGKVKGIRIDVNGAEGSVFELAGIKAVGTGEGAPGKLSISNSFHNYSDKIHYVTRVAASAETENIATIGNEIRIPVNSVSGLVIKDRNGWHYDLEDKINWKSVEYLGFMIDGVGVIGFILPYDSRENISLETDESGENFVVEISRILDGARIDPSVEGSNNANDFVMGYRLYTDTRVGFSRFIYEAECERNPLGEENFVIDSSQSGRATFVGYNSLIGYYKFNVDHSGGFNGPFYTYPNRHFGVRFTVNGDDKNRICYVNGAAGGSLECAVLLGGNSMLLPVPVQVGKNFSGDHDANIFNIDDMVYGEAILPIGVSANSSESYKLLHLYQNWGTLPLKQISSIQFHSPYYHLSTGVTETNCVVLYDLYGLALPDFRAFSAPFWDDQPQHNSCGTHGFVQYVGEDGIVVGGISTGSYIDSHGPTYAEMTNYFTSGDGKLKYSYNHMELPQTDENRTFYQIKIEFLDDLTFDSFKDDFVIYKVKSTDKTGIYTRVGYLNEKNEPTVTDANRDKGTTLEYVLGDNCPYFTFFYMKNYSADWVEGYSNPACLIYKSKITVGGEEQEISFMLKDDGESLILTLNADKLTFKAGDEIEIDGILLPWGSQELDSVYDTVINAETGEKYQDKNVRDVRENTLLNPMTLIAGDDCEALDSVFLPKAKTKDGKSAIFTVKGGANNIAVRVYGFSMLTVPTVEEYVDGEWVKFDISSASKPDRQGYGYLYDGYTVFKDADGSYSYAFAFDIGDGSERRFRVTADKEFEGFYEEDPFENLPLNVYISSENIAKLGSSLGTPFGCGDFHNDLEGGFFRFWGDGKNREIFVVPYSESDKYPTTGQYAVLKYRIPESNVTPTPDFEVFASSVDLDATGDGDYYKAFNSSIADGEWHVIVFDISSVSKLTPNADGSYRARFVRFDIVNASTPIPVTDYIDVEYFGISDSLEDICALNSDMEVINFSQNGENKFLDPKTGKVYAAGEEDSLKSPLNVYMTAKTLSKLVANGCEAKLSDDETYIRYTGIGAAESFVQVYSNKSASKVTGQYAVFKYRIPTDSKGKLGGFEVFASTTLEEPTGGSSMKFFDGIVSDGSWQVMIVDLSGIETYTANDSGEYKAMHWRLDVIDQQIGSEFFIDLAYVGMHDDIEVIMGFCTDNERITFIDKDKSCTVIRESSAEEQ